MPEVARIAGVRRLRIAFGSANAHSHHRMWFLQPIRWPEGAAIDLQCLRPQWPCEMRGEGIRQTQISGQLRAIETGPQNPHRDMVRPRGWHGQRKRRNLHPSTRSVPARPGESCLRRPYDGAAPGPWPRRCRAHGPTPDRSAPDIDVARVPNCSATTSGAWLGNMMPPLDPNRPRLSATWPIRIAVAALATPGML